MENQQYRPQHLTEQHYEHRRGMWPLLEQQQQRVSTPTGEITTKGQVIVIEEAEDQEIPYGD